MKRKPQPETDLLRIASGIVPTGVLVAFTPLFVGIALSSSCEAKACAASMFPWLMFITVPIGIAIVAFGTLLALIGVSIKIEKSSNEILKDLDSSN
jgi:hypothetical protein